MRLGFFRNLINLYAKKHYCFFSTGGTVVVKNKLTQDVDKLFVAIFNN